ncbi:MAG: hypothetical protein R3E79_50525 [Caldilineaceae bacterium]
MSDVWTLAGVNLTVVLPELVLFAFAILVMLADMTSNDKKEGLRPVLPWLALIGVGVTMAVCVAIWSQPVATFQGAAIIDNFAMGVKIIVLCGGSGYSPQCQLYATGQPAGW